MKKLWTTLLLFIGSKIVTGATAPHRKSAFELARIRAYFMYLRSIKTFRFLFISLLGVGVCLVFLMTGLILFHVSLFAYTPWSNEVKMCIGFSCAALYFLIATIIFYNIFSEKQWMKMFHADRIMTKLREEHRHESEQK